MFLWQQGEPGQVEIMTPATMARVLSDTVQVPALPSLPAALTTASAPAITTIVTTDSPMTAVVRVRECPHSDLLLACVAWLNTAHDSISEV